LHPDDRAKFSQAFLTHVKGDAEFYDVTYRARRTDGSWAWMQTRGRTVAWDANGRATLLAGTNYEVSELKNAELALKHSAEELELRVEQRTIDLTRALDELRAAQRQLVDSEKMAALGGLVAGVAHEINTPLGIGVTAASHLGEISQVLQRKIEANQLTKNDLAEFATQSQSAVTLVMSNLRRASDLVKSFKQVAVDQSSEQRRAIDVQSYLNDILNSLRPLTKKFPQNVRIEVAAELRWHSFPGALYQVISNLVLNALTHAFSEQQSGEIVISAAIIAHELVLQISDNGNGMESEVAKRIFEPFFTTKRGQGGSGLGLHIVFNLVTKVLGGTIRTETEVGQGTRFVITVPA
jgi:signal transduction histidine kinase